MFKFGEVLKKCQNYRFFDIFLDILHKIIEKNWGQEHVKGGFYTSRKKLEQFSLLSLENDSFAVLTLLFHPSLLESGFSALTKIIVLK